MGGVPGWLEGLWAADWVVLEFSGLFWFCCCGFCGDSNEVEAEGDDADADGDGDEDCWGGCGGKKNFLYDPMKDRDCSSRGL
jgi:hypothetical protein